VSSPLCPSRPKAKAFPLAPRAPWLAAALQSCPAILAINWCFQGMRGMDRGELVFRLLLESLLWLALVPATGPIPALLLAHTANFLANGQLWVCVRYCRFWRRSPAALDRFLREVAGELRAIAWLEEVACIGSCGAAAVARHDRADIDLRLIAPPGPVGWLRANLLLLRLRARALVRLVPLDVYVYDRPESLGRFRQDEPLLVILDRRGRLAELFATRQFVILR
jgi:hypothetical protein